ncbi:unnamed protein product [marine sediment metagenome]|uniref:Uncharacterized protein n=1 Tax=marine sediment metagenome TaxID=412755 RepID=X1DW63_9ZZZZ
MPKASKRGPRTLSYVQRLKRDLRSKAKAQSAALRSTKRDLNSLGVRRKAYSKTCRKC